MNNNEKTINKSSQQTDKHKGLAFLPLGMGLLVVGLTLGTSANKAFLVFIPVGLFFLIIMFVQLNKSKK